MRTTFTMVNRNVQQNLSNRYSNMVQLQEQLATGKRLRKPSDGPIDVANDIKLRTKQTQLKQYQRNIEDGLAVMGVASSAMGSMNELLHRMRELAVQGANDTNTAADRQYIQQETDQLFRQMLSVINTQFKGDYIFNGTQTKIPPYEIKASQADLKNYLVINQIRPDAMAAYGGDYIVNTLNGNIHNTGANPADTADFLYLDYNVSPLKVGDQIQMKWSSGNVNNNGGPIDIDGTDAKYIIPTDEMGFLSTIAIGGGTFNKYNGIDDPAHPNYIPNPDYTVDCLTGKVTILSESFKNMLNTIAPNADRTNMTDPDFANTRIIDLSNLGDAFSYSTKGAVQVLDMKYRDPNLQAPITNILPGSLKLKIGDKEYLEGFGEYDPGYYDEEGVFHEGKNKFDYSVNYITGEITIYNMDLMRDMRNQDSRGSYDPLHHLPPLDEEYYRKGGLELTFEHIKHGVNMHGDKVASHGQVYRAIEEGIAMQINLGVDEILRDKWTGLDMIGVLMRYNQSMRTDDRDGIQQSITELSSMYDAVLNSQSQMGARIYRLELTLSRNQEQYLEVSAQQSSLEDADLSETISKLMLAQNVYNAALQAAMRVLQPSLANFM